MKNIKRRLYFFWKVYVWGISYHVVIDRVNGNDYYVSCEGGTTEMPYMAREFKSWAIAYEYATKKNTEWGLDCIVVDLSKK